MRLDAYLVEAGYFKSRGRSKHAILAGNVKVSGIAVTKISRDVSIDDIIEVAEGLDYPKGYFKLKLVQEKSGILDHGDIVLDLGSSAGGFLLFSSEIAGHVKGIEFSQNFRNELKSIADERENVEVVFGDIFTIPLQVLSDEFVDVILFDITLEPEDSIKVLSRVLPLLRENGKLLHVIKSSKKKNPKPILNKMKNLGLVIQKIIDSEKQEIYVVARKLLPSDRESNDTKKNKFDELKFIP